MSPQLAEYFGLAGRNGALVVYVYPDSPASKTGLKAGDVIISIGGEPTDGPMKVHEALQSKPEGPVELRVMRDKQEKVFSVQVEKGKISWFGGPDDFALPEPAVHVIAIPKMQIEPIYIPRMAVGPINVTPLTRLSVSPPVAPVAIPKITIPEIVVPRMTLPPMKIVVPYRLRVTV
jgi:hypothetical protein